ncbi:MAG: signal recognition particle protein [Verrucomicrobia bacterium]|nr:signal recognition particle protein [Verrucomicrobiota bacterium]
MFDALTDKLQQIFKNLRGMGKISDSNVADSLREVRLALLEADVNFKVVGQFIEDVRTKAIGQEVIRSIQPGQQVIKIIHDELVKLLGASSTALTLDSVPSSILLCGLHGSGKTTSSGKLARYLLKMGKKPILVAADVYRPAAMDQLDVIGRQINIPVWVEKGETDVLKIAEHALEYGKSQGANVIIFDTAGRLQIDEPLVQELVRLKNLIKPREILLTLDAATGQEAVNVATHFNQSLDITGAILTKLDGDARGGAALSLCKVTGKPIKFAGTGEKLDAFEPFHPERMASRILGMGDVVSLVEKAAEAVDQEAALRLEEKVRKGQFTLTDFREQLRQMRKLGPLENIVGMLPGGSNMLHGANLNRSEKEFIHMEALICSMTPLEREKPQILNASRRKRIAKGAGVTVTELNNMLNKFTQLQHMMKKMSKFQKMIGKFNPTRGLF